GDVPSKQAVVKVTRNDAITPPTRSSPIVAPGASRNFSPAFLAIDVVAVDVVLIACLELAVTPIKVDLNRARDRALGEGVVTLRVTLPGADPLKLSESLMFLGWA